jgi:hypothetical protein
MVLRFSRARAAVGNYESNLVFRITGTDSEVSGLIFISTTVTVFI